MTLHTSADAPITCEYWDEVCAEDGFLALGRNRYHCSYVVYTDGTYYYAENGTTGNLDYGGPNNQGGISGVDFYTIFQTINDLLLVGGIIFIKKGTYSYSNGIELGDSVSVFGEGQETTILNYTGDSDAVTFREFTHKHGLKDLQIICNNIVSGNSALNIKSCNHDLVERVYMYDINGTFSYGIYHGGGFYSLFLQNRIEHFDKNIYLTRGDVSYSRCSMNNFIGGQIKNGRTYNIETVVTLSNHNVFYGIEIKITVGAALANVYCGAHNTVFDNNWMELGIVVYHFILPNNVAQCHFRGNIYSGGGGQFQNLGAVNTYVRDINNTANTIWRNSGTSVGTGVQQTIAHGLCATPSLVLLSEATTGGALAYQSAAADAVNIYITATLNKTYRWYASLIL